MKYLASIANPAESGFYRVYSESGKPYIGHFQIGPWGSSWFIGPKLPNGSLLLEMLPIEIYEWSEWEDL